AHPAAFAAVFLPMAGVALAGAWVTRRLRTPDGTDGHHITAGATEDVTDDL
ncbi:MFS transporter, partial [Streptomyces sp. SID625]|nr:MFS transporter [Streptomyces sp. SID625]